jgi:hypothetical protein
MTDPTNSNPTEDEDDGRGTGPGSARATTDNHASRPGTRPEPGGRARRRTRFSAAAVIGSPTLDALDESRRPKASTVCEHCPNSVWFASPAEVKCYCRVMFLVTWSSKEPNQITHCDGEFLGQEVKPEQVAAMDKYIAEREAKRLKGFDIPKHSRYTDGMVPSPLRVSETSRVSPWPS